MSARTILNPPLINELNGLFDGSTSIDVSLITLSNPTNSTENITLSCTDVNTLTVNAGLTSTLVVNNLEMVGPIGGETINLACTADNVLTVNPGGASTLVVDNLELVGPIGGETVNLACTADNVLTVNPGLASTLVVDNLELVGPIGGETVNLACTADNVLTVNPGGASSFVVGGPITGSQIIGTTFQVGTPSVNMPFSCVTSNVVSLGTSGNGAVSLAGIYFTGGLFLTVNSSNQLVFNGNVIS